MLIEIDLDVLLIVIRSFEEISVDLSKLNRILLIRMKKISILPFHNGLQEYDNLVRVRFWNESIR